MTAQTLPDPAAAPVSDLRHRIGTFTIGGVVLDDYPETAREILRDTVVVEARSDWAMNLVHYVAMHASFDVIPEGSVPLSYKVMCSVDEEAARFHFIRAAEEAR